MEEKRWESCNAEALLDEFFSQDDLRQLALSTGELLGCPLLVLDDTFRIAAHHLPLGFSDALFETAVRRGEITYEAGAIISGNAMLTAGWADYVQLADSPLPAAFCTSHQRGRAPRLPHLRGYGRTFEKIPPQTWELVEHILSKQLFMEVSRQDKPSETVEDILMHLLDGGFSSAAHFQLQASGIYLADFHPRAFALIDLETYHSAYMGKRHLKEELEAQIADSHPFLYQGDVFLFLHREGDADTLSALAKEFQLKILVSEPLDELFDLPGLYRTAREALELMTDERFHGEPVCSVAQLRTPLLLKNLEGRGDLIPIALRRLAAHNREKDTQYCETLYHYLTCCHSLKKTSDALYTHRNTVLYRIRRLQENFAIPLEEPSQHADLLLGVSLILFEIKGPDFFLRAPKNEA